MSRFLPESDHDYAVPKLDPEGFTDAETTLLRDIGRKMKVNLARSKGRIPSPFSQAYLFYLNLFATGFDGGDDLSADSGRERLRDQARRTFRGLCATFALRKVLDLNIQLRQKTLDEDGTSVEKQIYPAVRSAPRDEEYWNPICFYTVRQDADSPSEVLAGQSPLTGLYPAANAPSQLNALYWYDASSGRWYDPTSDYLSAGQDSLSVSEEAQDTVKRLLKAWLDEAIGIVKKPNALSNHGLTSHDEAMLQSELEEWHNEISVPATDRALVDDTIRVPDGPNAQPLPFLQPACPIPSHPVTSDVPVHDGRLLVRKQDLTSTQKRLFGRETGKHSYQGAIEDLPPEGENLGRDLGLDDDVLPCPYLFVNKLFVPKLTPLTADGFSEEWDGIVIDGENYLLPFRPEILNLMSPEELVERTSAELSSFDDKYRVYLEFGEGDPIEQRYVEKGDDEAEEYVVDAETIPPETFDLRLFPDFQLDAVSDKLVDEDQKYYARVRLAPTWDFRIGPLHHDAQSGVTKDGSTEHPVEKTRVGNFRETVQDNQFSRGEALFITCEDQPDGFYVEGHGLCVLSLSVPAATSRRWEVGVDFGTSNTCVSFRPDDPAGDDSPRIRDLPVLTTTLFEDPKYDQSFENPYGALVNERASALLDFFYRQSQSDRTLNSQSYFPTQFITRHTEVNLSPKWDFENGLIFFRNIGIGAAIDVRELIEGYPSTQEGGRHPKRDFKAKQDLKWQNPEWLEAFMGHLRRQVSLTAARKNAEIMDLKFSYPEAFTATDRSRFEDAISRTWGDLMDDGGGQIQLCSEAEAVRNKFVDQTGDVIVLDIGGGTTDVIAFHDDRPIFQTSYRIAAGLINDYVAASTAFRNAFLEAMKKVLKDRYELPDVLEARFKEPAGRDEGVIKTIWIGLLNLIEQATPDLQQILHKLRDPQSNIANDERTQEAVQGFFLSVTFLFTGTAFNAGVLLHAASRGELSEDQNEFEPEFVDLELTGNGSKLLRMLHESAQAFDPVLKGAFYRGMCSAMGTPPKFDSEDITFRGIDQWDSDTSPKVSVSLGLLEDNVFDVGPDDQSGVAGEVPVANIVSEKGLEMNGSRESEINLIDFYEEAYEKDYKAPETPPDLLEAYLESLNDLLPRGNNRGAQVLPGVGENWHGFVRQEVYPRSRRGINDRVKKNAASVADHLRKRSRDDIPALESPFIVELRSLIKQVQKDYAQPS
ncbi:MAG: hypothetical protein ABEK75_04030 [Salinibacter sp.]